MKLFLLFLIIVSAQFSLAATDTIPPQVINNVCLGTIPQLTLDSSITAVVGTNPCWFDEPTAGNKIGQGNPFTLPFAVSGNAIIYFGGCLTGDTRYPFIINTKNCVLTASLTATPTSICKGKSSILTVSVEYAQSSITYQWSSGNPGAATATVNPANTTTYIVTVISGTSSVTASATVTVNALPNVTAGGVTICAGLSSTITAGGASTYTWSNSLGGGAEKIVNPTVSSTYSVTGTETIHNCSNTAQAIVMVNPLPILTANVETICMGESTSLSASGADTYLWSNGVGAGATVTVSPPLSTTYTVTGTETNYNCSNTIQAFVTVNPLPTVTAAGGSICLGGKIIIIAGGANIYSWSNGAGSGAIVTVSPPLSTTYTVTGTETTHNCSDSAQAIVMVNASLPVTAGGGTVCNGSSITITASGATDFIWDQGLGSGASVTVSPTVSTIYTVTGSSGITCVNTAQALVQVNPLPTIVVGGEDVCIGSAAVLTVGGTSLFYKWDQGLGSGASVTVSPTVSAIYTVTGIDGNNCSNTALEIVTINPLPIITASHETICSGSATIISAMGANSYSWDNSLGAGNFKTVYPTISSTYTVTGTDVNSCTNTAQAIIHTNPLPSVQAGPDTSICIGAIAILTVSGSGTYLWNDAGQSTNQIIVTPNSTTTYSVTVTNGYGCQAIAYSIVSIRDSLLPGITGKQSICFGDSTSLTVNAIGATNFIWSTGETNNIIITPKLTTSETYAVTVSNTEGCSGQTAVIVKVNPLPMITIIPGDTELCSGQQLTLIGRGAVSYVWDQGIFNDISFTPLQGITIYTVTGTDGNNCTGMSQTIVTVNPSPTVTASDTVICNGLSAEISASGADNYTWDNNLGNGNPKTVTPVISTTYTVIGTGANSCTNSAQAIVTVNPLPETPIIPQTVVCSENKNAIVNIGNINPFYTYSWFDKPDGLAPIHQGFSDTIYNVLTADTIYVEATGNGCNSLSKGEGIISIGQKPFSIFTYEPTPVIENIEVTFTNSSASNISSNDMQFTWWFGNGEGSSFMKEPTHIYRDTGNYIVQLIVINHDGCEDTSQQTITVKPLLKPWIPEAFSPNGDSYNDTLFVRGPIKTMSFEILTQWALKVFESSDQSKGWDGKCKGIEMPEGNYFYILRGTDLSGNGINQEGIVTLIR